MTREQSNRTVASRLSAWVYGVGILACVVLITIGRLNSEM